MSFAVLALICLVALVGPLLLLRPGLRLPVVISELAVGLVLGTTGFGLLDANDQILRFMAEIGFALVMFIAGSHVPIREPAMREGLKVGVLRAAAIGVLSIPAGFGIAWLFDSRHGALYAVLLASSSAALIMPMLSGAPLTSKSMVQFVPQIAIADAVCIIALPLAINPSTVVRVAIGSVAVLVAAVVVFLVFRWAEASGHRRRIHDVSEDRGLAIELRIALTLLFAVAALAAAMQVSVMLAGFSLGLAVAAVGEPRRLANQIFALSEGFFAPIFFVWLGAGLNLRELADRPSAIGLGLALGAAALLVHGLLAFTGQRPSLALLSAAQLGVPMAAVSLGETLKLFEAGEGAAILLGALVTIVVSSIMGARVDAERGESQEEEIASLRPAPTR